MEHSTLTRQQELFPGDETRTLIGLSLPSFARGLLLFPPEESHVDLVVNTREIGIGYSLRDVYSDHTPATRGLAAVFAQEFGSCEVFLSLSRPSDEESYGGASFDDDEEPLQRTFLVKFSELPDGEGDLVIYGTQGSDQDFGLGDWWRLFRRSEVEPPTFFTVRLMEKDGEVVFGHPQMKGLLNCCKQILNGELRKHEEERKHVLGRALFNRDEEHAWAETLALKLLMEEDATAIALA